ncbi:NAD-dependent epimerase/dehydratase family protein [Bacillus sp. 165]|uniref:NAD-dependent epimerase/dehydratase family protein n=1 Tax=Bacillus sp. 165 TaxID=1529117 RepID=UPI001ADC029E|nr:NAD-dependent epimerase/dehydratase family protein [Bacillus sp. 165]
MKGAAVVGVWSFVGYHLLLKLLDEEVDVVGIDQEPLSKLSRINEEKLFLIGRNAYFSYYSLQEKNVFQQMQPDDIDTVFFCLYEPNQPSFPSEREEEKTFKEVIRYCAHYKKRLVFLSSIEASAVHLHTMKGKKENHISTENGNFFYKREASLTHHQISYAVLQVPVVYGPWQPSFMTYHQLILSHILNQDLNIESNETSEDSIYVSDVAQCLYEMGKQETSEIYFIESGQSEQWKKGIELLKGETEGFLTPKPSEKHTALRYAYRPQFTLKEGLIEQEAHIKKYQHLYNT